MQSKFSWHGWVLLCALLSSFYVSEARANGSVQFNRDVQPIIADNCYPCHGPDAKTRKRDIRFDLKEGLLGKTKGGLDLIVPGKPDASELFKRVTHTDVDERMPPAESKLHLTPEQIDTLSTWITQGAVWEGHWAFIPPVKPSLPEVSDSTWPKNEIDFFILERLDAAGLLPSPEANKETLIRRVSLDLTGLPPTPAEVEAFLADTSEDAYETVVDRLLASPHYGERMAFVWLDAARYSDTHGYQRDTMRIMWPWRDWVIKAYNDNMPFDQFAVEQLAGDLLPEPTLEQKIATGFNRNHRINGEGGIIPEEYAVEYVVDRVHTTSTAFMGLSMGCARCHDHKFDPFTQREFYELYAFFNQVPEEGKGRETGNDVPVVKVPTPEQLEQEKVLAARLSEVEARLAEPDERLDALQVDWEADMAEKFAKLDWDVIDHATVVSENGAIFEKQEDLSVLATGPVPATDVYTVTFEVPRAISALKLEVLTDESLPKTGPGRASDGHAHLTGVTIERARAASPRVFEALPIATALANYAHEKGKHSIKNVLDDDPLTSWSVGGEDIAEDSTAVFVIDESADVQAGDHITVTLRHEKADESQHIIGRFRLSQSPARDVVAWARQDLGPWHYVGPIKVKDGKSNTLIDVVLPPEEGFDAARTYGDDKLGWVEKPEWEDGKVIRFEGTDQAVHYLHRTIHAEIATSVTLSLGSNDAIKVWLDGQEKLANNVGRQVDADQETLTLFLTEGSHDILIKIVNYGGETGYYFRLVDDDGAGLLRLMALLDTPPAERSEESTEQLRLAFRERDPGWVAKKDEVESVQDEIDVLEKSIITTMVMEDMETPRDTFRLVRGEYDKPDESEKLLPSVPAALGEMDESLPKNRLGFAKWLVDPNHPLTARVEMNHSWQIHFGRGLVKTSEDFGTQGTPPTHPDLLDWLAVAFIDSGWDMKAMHKKVVTSATYRQASQVTGPAAEKDPANLLLARAPRVRLAAEIVRDQALAASGLLVPDIGGPSVKPYQPEDLWSALTFQNMDEYDTNFYVQDTGDKLYRRGLYTYWKRTILPPHMQIFNAAGREMCSMRQENTNTPMQALVALNETSFVEAARHLAERMILEGGERSNSRILYGYKLLLAHEPNQRKQEILLGALNDYQTHFIRNQDDAKEILSVGDSVANPDIPEPELAAYTMLASVMLNLDEAITRE